MDFYSAGLAEHEEWFSQFLMDSGPGAYDILDDSSRGLLKDEIAFLHNYYGEVGSTLFMSKKRLKNGVVVDLNSKITPWLMIVMEEGYASPSGLLSAVLPALLSGVENIMVVNESDAEPQDSNLIKPLPLAISAALELSGQEDVFCMDSVTLSRALTLLSNSFSASGRVIVLSTYNKPRDTCKLLMQTCLELNLPFTHLLYENCHPYIVNKEQETCFNFFHPQVKIKDRVEDDGVCLAQQREHLWFWPSLQQSFFFNNFVSIS